MRVGPARLVLRLPLDAAIASDACERAFVAILFVPTVRILDALAMAVGAATAGDALDVASARATKRYRGLRRAAAERLALAYGRSAALSICTTRFVLLLLRHTLVASNVSDPSLVTELFSVHAVYVVIALVSETYGIAAGDDPGIDAFGRFRIGDIVRRHPPGGIRDRERRLPPPRLTWNRGDARRRSITHDVRCPRQLGVLTHAVTPCVLSALVILPVFVIETQFMTTLVGDRGRIRSGVEMRHP